MRTKLKPLILSIVLICFCFAASAQTLTVADSLRVGAGIEGLAGVGTLGKAYSGGVGVSVRLDVPLSSKIYVTGSVGYNNFFASATADTSLQSVKGVSTPSFKTVPLKLGIKWFPFKKFYIQGEAGETILLNKNQVYALYNSAFTWSPQFGVVCPLRKHRAYIDAGIRFEGVSSFYNDNSTYNFWALHVAYTFNL
jgi:hypothetical protein